MILEKATFDDASEILELQKAAYQSEAELYNDYTIEPLVQTLSDMRVLFDRCSVFVVRKDKRIVGSVHVRLEGKKGHVGKVIVIPDLQGTGIGSFMLDAIEEEFPEVDTFELFTGFRSERNLAIYQHKGYVPYKTEMLSEEFGFVYLRKVK